MPCCLRADRWARATLTSLKRLCSEDSICGGLFILQYLDGHEGGQFQILGERVL